MFTGRDLEDILIPQVAKAKYTTGNTFFIDIKDIEFTKDMRDCLIRYFTVEGVSKDYLFYVGEYAGNDIVFRMLSPLNLKTDCRLGDYPLGKETMLKDPLAISILDTINLSTDAKEYLRNCQISNTDNFIVCRDFELDRTFNVPLPHNVDYSKYA